MNITSKKVGVKTVKALKNGSLEAFNRVYAAYGKKLANYVYNLSKNTVLTEDVVQETFLILWNKRQTIDEKLSLDGFLFTIARNEFLKSCRDKTKERMFLDEIRAEVYQETYVADNKNELLTKVRKIIDELSPKCKEAFLASKFENLTYAEISERMGISKKTVELHISKAYSIIRDKVKIVGLFFL